MNIAEAKQHVKDTVEAYLEKDEDGIYCIEPSKQRPVFLLGAPGIGKTAIMAQIAQELQIGLVSYSMTHHTRQSALGLPMIVHRSYEDLEYESSEYTMSEIVASVYEYIETNGIKRGILFLDEINCVSETLYPSMLQFLQFKTFGRHRIPKDWIVVCAGNPPEYNRSVHDFDIVTLDRLRKIEVEPDYAAWRTYAYGKGVHPSILSYLEVKKDSFYKVESTPRGKKFVTARGWEDLSEIIALFERMGKPIDKNLISQFLQDDEIAERFAAYYNLFDKYRSDYQIESILSGEAPQEIIARAQDAKFDERLALLGLILDALSNECAATLSLESVLAQTRDVLKEFKTPMLEGASLADTFMPRVEALKNELKRGIDAGTFSSERIRERKQFIARLEEFVGVCADQRLEGGKDAFDVIHYEYRSCVSEFEQAMKSCNARIDNAFGFVDTAFESGREALVFVTELTARPQTSLFISRFGNESYYAHNEGLKVEEHRKNLIDRVGALDLDAAASRVNAQAAGASAQEIEYAEIKQYYDNAEHEFNYASLCKMTLPDNLIGKTVLDIGCRRGKGIFRLSDRVGNTGHVIGLEWTGDQIKEAASRSERAWKDTGLSSNNMSFIHGYPEDMKILGIKDSSVDVVFINSVFNLLYQPYRTLEEIYRVLKPGGLFICEGVLADRPRDEKVVEAARALGNSIQSAPYKEEFEQRAKELGFTGISYIDGHDVLPDQGYKTTYKVEVAENDETDIRFVAAVAHLIKRS